MLVFQYRDLSFCPCRYSPKKMYAVVVCLLALQTCGGPDFFGVKRLLSSKAIHHQLKFFAATTGKLISLIAFHQGLLSFYLISSFHIIRFNYFV